MKTNKLEAYFLHVDASECLEKSVKEIKQRRLELLNSELKDFRNRWNNDYKSKTWMKKRRRGSNVIIREVRDAIYSYLRWTTDKKND